MKIQVTTNEINRAGYFWASPDNSELSTADNFLNLSNVCHPGECDEVYGPQILDSIPVDKLENVLLEWVRLLKKDGIIKVGGTDPYMVSKLLLDRKINTSEFNHVLSGKYFAAAHPLSFIKEFFRKINMKILSIKAGYDDGLYVVEAQKT